MQKKYIILLILIFSITAFAQSVLRVGNVYPGEVEMGGFTLSVDATIQISGEGASFDEWNNYLNYYAWILETDSREVVWRSKNCEDFAENDGAYDFDSNIKLKAGNYEVYYSAGVNSKKYYNNGLSMLQGLFHKKQLNLDEYRKRFFIKISSGNGFKIKDAYQLVDNRNKDAVAALIRVGDSEKLTKKISLNADTKIKIYGIGEGSKREFYDFGYIYDVVQNKIVWMFNRENKSYAGGGKKNVRQNAEIILPKGSYEICYRTDDSHSFDEWNVLPPDDPQYWGIVVYLSDMKEKKNIIPFREEDIVKPIIDITRVENDEFRSKGFTLTKPLELRIFALGEGRHNLVDYGWIENADTKEVVWEMDYEQTTNAGGARKNRKVDDIIRLNTGNYIVYYITDDSHNYDDWNAAPPYEEEKWGITIWILNKKDKSFVRYFDAQKFVNKNLIIEIIKVGDDENIKKDFSLNKISKIRIIAMGESSGNELVDYAWITDSGGKTVWKMEYNETAHAGGADKNRIFNDVIKLKSGKYTLHYKTDDSHSFDDWNSSPPDRPEMYGASLLIVN